MRVSFAQWLKLELERKWRAVTIDALCVHIHAADCINVTLPVAADMLYDRWSYDWKKDDIETNDINVLISMLSERAFAIYTEEEPFVTDLQEEFTDCGYDLIDEVEWHKKKLHHFGDEVFLTREARSDRPAFCATGYKSRLHHDVESKSTTPEKKRLWYAYNAMGLPRQHAMQYSILSSWVFEQCTSVCRERLHEQ